MTVEVPELMRRALSKETDGRPLPRNEFDLLAEALFQYGDDPSGTPEEGQDPSPRLPHSPSGPRPTTRCCLRVI